MGGRQARLATPGEENLRVEVAVRDAGDGRFVPGMRSIATPLDPDGDEVGTHEQPLLWRPVIHHYGRNWADPRTASASLRERATVTGYSGNEGPAMDA